MPTMNEMFPSRFANAASLAGKTLTLTVSHVEGEKMGDGSWKNICHFSDSELKVVLNKTRAKVLASAAQSHDTKDWKGVKVGVRTGTTTLRGEQTSCVEFFVPTAIALDDEVPF
jgi:hypothetical protein